MTQISWGDTYRQRATVMEPTYHSIRPCLYNVKLLAWIPFAYTIEMVKYHFHETVLSRQITSNFIFKLHVNFINQSVYFSQEIVMYNSSERDRDLQIVISVVTAVTSGSRLTNYKNAHRPWMCYWQALEAALIICSLDWGQTGSSNSLLLLEEKVV